MSAVNLSNNKDFSFQRSGNTIETSDPTRWKVKILLTSNTEKAHLRNAILSTPFPSFQALLENEAQTRSDEKTISPQKLLQISHSAQNRNDLTISLSLSPEIQKALHYPTQEHLTSKQTFLKNSPLNGKSYLDENQHHAYLSQAVTSSNDRTAKTMSMGRVIEKTNGESICYAGRQETKQKALEEAEMIFKHERKTKEKGLKYLGIDASGRPQYELTYVVHSLLNASIFKKPKAFNEKNTLKEEHRTLKDLNGTSHLIDGCQVVLRPILISKHINFESQFENLIPSYLSGKLLCSMLSKEGLLELKKIIENYNGPDKQDLFDAFDKLSSQDLLPEEELLLKEYIVRKCKLPIVYHCKSSIDRTTMASSIAVSFGQWINVLNDIPRDENGKIAPEQLAKNSHFKELFAANIIGAFPLTSAAREAKGPIEGIEINNTRVGFSWEKGFLTTPLLTRLLPDRYLKNTSHANALLCFCYLLWAVTLPLQILLELAASLYGVVTWQPEYIQLQASLTPLFKIHSFPLKKTIDSESPHICARNLLV